MALNVHVQWAKTKAPGYTTLPLADWPGLAKKADPKLDADSKLDSDDGLVAHACVLGHQMSEDHVSVEPWDAGRVRLCGWSDASMPDGSPFAKVLEISEEIVTTVREYDPEPGVHMREEMRGPYHTMTVYCAKKYWPKGPVYCNPGQVKFAPYKDFVPPSGAVTKHGILVDDALWKEHAAIAPPDDLPT